MRRVFLPLLAAGFLSTFTAVAEAAPADIAGISKVSKAIEANLHLTGSEAETALLSEYTRLVVIQAAWIADAQGIGKLTKVRSPGFHAHVKRMLKPMVSKAADIEVEVERKKKWYELLRNSSTGSAGHRALASWLEFKAPGAYLSKAKRGDPPRVTKQVEAVSTDSRLQIVQDKVTLGGEIGDAGEGNGIIDAGEWVNLGLQVYNNDKRGFFSSSAWIETQAECAWVPPALEIEMSELPAAPEEEEETGMLKLKKAEPPTQGLDAWVFLSSACADRSVVPLQVRIKDTHRAATTPIIVSAKMTVRNRTMGKAVNFLADTDVPGVSDGRSMPAVSHARVFELTHGFVAAQSGLMSARTGWGVHEDVGSIIKQQQAPLEPMLGTGEGRFLPGDDLDISTVKLEDFDRILQARADDDRWNSLEDARAWFAADTEVLYETPDPPTEVVEEIPDEICDNYLDDDGDGKHDCQDSDCKTAKVCNPSAPVALGALMSLIKSNVDIVANPATPTITGAVDAVEPGYELVIDAGTIGTQYDCLVAGISPDQCTKCEDLGIGLDACKTCITEGTELRLCGLDVDCEEEEKEEKVEEIDTGRDPAVAYKYRNYFTMPLGWNPHESPDFNNCRDEWDNDLDGLVDREDPDCGYEPEVVKPPKPPKDPMGHRVDLGLLVGQTAFGTGPTIDWLSSGGAIMMGNLRYVLTPRNGGPIRPIASYGVSQSNKIAHKSGSTADATFKFSSVGAGLVYHHELTDSLALEARGLVNNRTFDIASDLATDENENKFSDVVSSTGAEVGLEAHYKFGFGLGIYLGAGGVIHSPVMEDSKAIVTTGIPALTAGLNWTVDP